MYYTNYLSVSFSQMLSTTKFTTKFWNFSWLYQSTVWIASATTWCEVMGQCMCQCLQGQGSQSKYPYLYPNLQASSKSLPDGSWAGVQNMLTPEWLQGENMLTGFFNRKLTYIVWICISAFNYRKTQHNIKKSNLLIIGYTLLAYYINGNQAISFIF